LKIRVFLVGEVASIAGRRFVELEFQGGEVTVGDVLEKLRDTLSSFRAVEDKIYLYWVLVGDVIVGKTARLRDGDEVTIMPPLYEGG
jgi:molybdopterin converting factor small subunit